MRCRLSCRNDENCKTCPFYLLCWSLSISENNLGLYMFSNWFTMEEKNMKKQILYIKHSNYPKIEAKFRLFYLILYNIIIANFQLLLIYITYL